MVREGLLPGPGGSRQLVGQGDRPGVQEVRQAVPPDANPGLEERFKEISAAYDVLGEQEKRKEYDELVASGRRGTPSAWPDPKRAPVAGSGSTIWATSWAPSSVAPPRAAPEVAAPDRSSGARISRLRPAPVVPRCRRGHHHQPRPDQRRRLLHLWGQRGRAGGRARWSARCAAGVGHQRQPGVVLVQPGLPGVRRDRDAGGGPLPHLPRDRHRAAGAAGEGADPRRGGGRPAHPGQGARRCGPRWRPGRRSLRRRAGGSSPGLWTGGGT